MCRVLGPPQGIQFVEDETLIHDAVMRSHIWGPPTPDAASRGFWFVEAGLGTGGVGSWPALLVPQTVPRGGYRAEHCCCQQSSDGEGAGCRAWF